MITLHDCSGYCNSIDLLQGLYGWDMVRSLPPGNGTMPDMSELFGMMPKRVLRR